jgi:Cu2+-exporting ATPase
VFPSVLLIAGGAIAYVTYGKVARVHERRRTELIRVNRPRNGSTSKNNHELKNGIKNLAARVCNALAPKQLEIAAGETDIGSIEEWSGRYFAASSIAMPLALIGIWVPMLGVISISILAMLTLPLLQRAYKGIVEQKRLKMEVIELVVLPLLIISGYLPAAAFGYWAYYLGIMFLARAKNRSASQVSSIISETLQFVWIQKGEHEIEVAVKDLQINDLVIVQGGGIIPVDGIVEKGLASVDQKMLTGEAQPAEIEKGDSVFAFTTVLAGKLWIKAQKTGQQTVALQINAVLEQTFNFAASVESRVENVADCLALPTLALGALALPVAGYTSALVVLDSAIIDNLYITGNLSILTHLTKASGEKLLIKDGRVLERLRELDTIVFDKTGTLTQEEPHVGRIFASHPDYTEVDVLCFAAIAEHRQSHPIAKAVIKESEARKLTFPTVDDTRYEVGYGIKVSLLEKVIRVGSRKYMELEGIPLTEDMTSIQAEAHSQGYSLVYVAVGSEIVGIIELHPTVRPEAKLIVNGLKRRGLSTYIISGDHEAPTRALASELGIEHYIAETLPEEKASRIAQLQQEGRKVCFVGDGINDAIALKAADVSISLSGASSIARDAAQIVLMDGNLGQLERLFQLTDTLEKNFRKSVLWDVLPNSASILGAFFFHLGIYGALAIYTAGLAGGVINGMVPLLKKGEKESVDALASR